jgi:uridine kinase
MDPAQADTDDVLGTVERLVLAPKPSCGEVTVVAIDGPSGSGKSTLAAALANRLGAPVVHLDDIYPGWDGLAEAVPLLTSQVLEPLARGEHAAYQRWDWVQNRWAATVSVPRVPLLIVEGVGSSVRPAGDFAAVRIWVEADRAVRFERGMARDGAGYRPWWERWARQEDALFTADGTRQRADIVVDTTTL